MKLFEEFKLYEDMWENNVETQEPAAFAMKRMRRLDAEEDSELAAMIRRRSYEQSPEKHSNDAKTNPVIRTFGRKTYNLADSNELFAWWRANLEFQMKRYPDRYKGKRGSANDYKLHATIAKNLISTLKADGVTNQKIFDELEGVVTGNTYMANAVDADLNEVKSELKGIAYKYLKSSGQKESKIIFDELANLVEKTADGFLSELDNIIYHAHEDSAELTEAADPNGMAYWAAEHLGDLYTMIDTKTPKAGTPAYNKKCRDANKRVKERWNIANDDESMDIIFKGYSFWKHYFK